MRDTSKLVDILGKTSLTLGTLWAAGVCGWGMFMPREEFYFESEVQSSPSRPVIRAYTSYCFQDWNYDGRYNHLAVLTNCPEDPLAINPHNLTEREIQELYGLVQAKKEKEK